MKPLYNDITRCYVRDCPIKDDCLRYLTIAIDNDGLYSYQSSMQDTEQYGGKDCDYFMEHKL